MGEFIYVIPVALHSGSFIALILKSIPSVNCTQVLLANHSANHDKLKKPHCSPLLVEQPSGENERIISCAF